MEKPRLPPAASQRRPATLATLAALAAWLVLAPATAEIYRYQDADGNWQFSDRPPPDQQFEPVPEQYARDDRPDADLAAKLEGDFQPRTPIERATLAVVAIEHGLGAGSGFFISSEGHILTNRHVVRPTEFGQWKESGEQLDAEEKELASLNDQQRDLERQVEAMAEDLKRAEEMLEGVGPAQREEAVARFERMKESLGYREARLDEARKVLDKRERELRRKRLDFNWQSTATSLQNSFKVVLKDKTELTARLLATSDDQDLALLKVEGHTTPAIAPADGGWLSQGEVVFAVGNPLGMADALTSGVITTLKDGKIVTDAQILPGNSGGPLLNQNGEVIGVNVLKVSAGDSVYDQGFGMAIPIAVAIKQFRQLQQVWVPKSDGAPPIGSNSGSSAGSGAGAGAAPPGSRVVVPPRVRQPAPRPDPGAYR